MVFKINLFTFGRILLILGLIVFLNVLVQDYLQLNNRLKKQQLVINQLENKIKLQKEKNKQQQLLVDKYQLSFLKVDAKNKYLTEQVNKEKIEYEKARLEEEIRYLQELTLN